MHIYRSHLTEPNDNEDNDIRGVQTDQSPTLLVLQRLERERRGENVRKPFSHSFFVLLGSSTSFFFFFEIKKNGTKSKTLKALTFNLIHTYARDIIAMKTQSMVKTSSMLELAMLRPPGMPQVTKSSNNFF